MEVKKFEIKFKITVFEIKLVSNLNFWYYIFCSQSSRIRSYSPIPVILKVNSTIIKRCLNLHVHEILGKSTKVILYDVTKRKIFSSSSLLYHVTHTFFRFICLIRFVPLLLTGATLNRVAIWPF